MKQTHKFQSLGDVAAVVNAAPSLAAAARQLGVDRSSVSRWIKAGKVTRHQAAAAPSVQSETVPPESWAQWARDTYDLSATEHTLVDLTDRALTMARDPANSPEVQLKAMARFQALVRQLNLEQEPADGEVEKTTRGRCITWPRRVDGAVAGA
jgi:transposase-like protein